MLRFRLVGAFEAYRGDERIPPAAWRTRHAQSTLEILLDQRDRPVAFERLADLVWPEADPAAARNSLQVAIGTIRRVLEPDLHSGSASRYVRTEGSADHFVADGCAIDADEFAHQRERALAAERAGDRERAIASFRASLALYRGEYLADDPHAEWLLATREQLRESVLDLSERLSRALFAMGRRDEAVAAAERGLAIDPLREELYQAAMRSHLAAGRRSHALAVYERCRRVLLTELGVEPSDATRSLRDASASPTAARPRTAVASPPPGPPVDIPFVGRSAELAALRDAWQHAGRETGMVALLHGPAGVGKTRALLVLDDSHWADEATAVWLGYLTRRLPAGTLLLVTRRSGEPGSHTLDAQIAERRKADRLADVALGPLSRELAALPELAQDLDGEQRGPRATTSGSPCSSARRWCRAAAVPKPRPRSRRRSRSPGNAARGRSRSGSPRPSPRWPRPSGRRTKPEGRAPHNALPTNE